MNDLFSALLALILGAFLAANISFLRKLLSIEEFFLGLMRGLAVGERWKKGKRK